VERLRRAAVYGAAGTATDFAFNRLSALVHDRELLEVHTSPWMLPLYALIQPLYEPLHDRLRSRPRALRAAAYGVGFLAVEYASGRLLRRLRGQAPWDYSHARTHVHGLTRLDYLPLWAAAGLGLERLHDRLVRSSERLPAAARRRSAATRSTAQVQGRSRS